MVRVSDVARESPAVTPWRPWIQHLHWPRGVYLGDLIRGGIRQHQREGRDSPGVPLWLALVCFDLQDPTNQLGPEEWMEPWHAPEPGNDPCVWCIGSSRIMREKALHLRCVCIINTVNWGGEAGEKAAPRSSMMPSPNLPRSEENHDAEKARLATAGPRERLRRLPTTSIKANVLVVHCSTRSVIYSIDHEDALKSQA